MNIKFPDGSKESKNTLDIILDAYWHWDKYYVIHASTEQLPSYIVKWNNRADKVNNLEIVHETFYSHSCSIKEARLLKLQNFSNLMAMHNFV